MKCGGLRVGPAAADDARQRVAGRGTVWRVDPLAAFLRRAPHFKGSGRVLKLWLDTRRGKRTATLSGGLTLDLDMRTPYEAMIWIGFEEQVELATLSSLLEPGDVFVDCGANIGLWSMTAAALVAPDGLVQAIEPNPYTFARLAAHAAQSTLVEVHNLALADMPGALRFDPGDTHNLGHVNPAGALTVEASRLDDLVNRPPTGIKIDVEGFELPVLQGATAALRHRPWLSVELNREHGGNCLSEWPVHHFLSDLGYQASDFVGRTLSPDWGPPHGYANVLYRCPHDERRPTRSGARRAILRE